MKLILFILISIVLCISCASSRTNSDSAGLPDRKFARILGTWVSESPRGTLYEVWHETNENTYSGKGFMIVGEDTVFSETISLEYRGGEVFYIPTVSNQNNGAPILFRLTSYESKKWVFENPRHDFPQRIIYEYPQTDVLRAVVEGNDRGQFRQEEFLFKKARK